MIIFKKRFKVGDEILAQLDDEHSIEGVIESENDDEFYVFGSDQSGCYHWTFDKATAHKYFRRVKKHGRKRV